MSTLANIFKQSASTRMIARPLTLKEVLRLRDGMQISKTFNSNYPYQTQIISNDKRILLALN